jgi:putative ABC transport system substrate-binding protein
MNGSISRRAALVGGIVGLVNQTHAQTSRTWRLAYLGSGRATVTIPVIKNTLQGLGYQEGRNLTVDVREAGGNYALLDGLVQELVALKPDVIVAEATPAIAAAQKATTTIPIVMAPSTDPVGSGFVRSFARPGGNITGVANMFGDLTAKTFDIIRLVFPRAKKIGVLTSNNPTHAGLFAVAQDAGKAIGMEVENYTALTPEDLDATFARMKAANQELVYVLADPTRPTLPSIALKYRLPSIYQVNTYPELEGLMSYGPEILELFVKAAHYVDRIFKGANPAEIPVEQPTRFIFVVNLRAAKLLDVQIPESVLLMAEKVIE